MRKGFAVVAVLLFSALGCSGDSTAVVNASMSGRWAYSASNIVSGSVSCAISGMTFQLTQNGSTFTGSTTGGNLTCSAPGTTGLNSNLANDVVANGTVNGSAIGFDIGTSDIHNTGTLNGSSISGTVTIRIVVSGQTYLLTGPFSAVKTG